MGRRAASPSPHRPRRRRRRLLLVAALLGGRRHLVPRRPARRPAGPGRDAPHRRDGSGDGGVRRQRSASRSRSSRSSASRCRSSEVSPNLTKAIIAIEDQRFYDHHGFDLVRIASAALANLRHGRARAGRQHDHAAARAPELPDARTRRYRRKLQELILAARLERLYTKPQILELYLNKVYFGDGLYGVEAASRGYFGKHASEVTVAEAALLAGLVKSPSSYAPTVSLERAVARRNIVLQAMLETGAIDRADLAVGARQQGRRCTTRCARRSRTASTSRSRCGRSWSTASAGSASIRAACASSRRSTCRCRSPPRRRSRIRSRSIETRRARLAGAPRRRASEGRQGAGRRTVRRRCRPRWSRSIRTPATCARWSAAATSTPATSTAPCRRTASPARRSSRSSTPPRSKAGYHAGDGPRSPQRSDRDRCRARGRRRTNTRRADSMSLRTGLRTSSNRAAVRLLQEVGIPRDGAVREDDGRRRRAERAVAGARLRRGDAAVDDRGLRRVRQSRPGPAADADPPRRGSRRPRALPVAGHRRSARSATRPRS